MPDYTEAAKTDAIKYCLKTHSGVSPDNITSADLQAAGCLDRVAVLPKPLNERLSYLSNVVVQSIRSVKCDDDLRSRMGSLTQALCYMMNSTSWADGELYDFDEQAITRKLQHFCK